MNIFQNIFCELELDYNRSKLYLTEIHIKVDINALTCSVCIICQFKNYREIKRDLMQGTCLQETL